MIVLMVKLLDSALSIFPKVKTFDVRVLSYTVICVYYFITESWEKFMNILSIPVFIGLSNY